MCGGIYSGYYLSFLSKGKIAVKTVKFSEENDHNIYIMADCQTDSDIGMIIIVVVHTFFQAFIPALTRL